LDLIALILCFLSVLSGIASIVVIVRIAHADKEIPRVRDGDLLPPAPGLLSIVIPAHNEARVIAASVQGLRRQTRRNFEAIYVLDRCTDETKSLLLAAAEGDPRIRLIENASCPDDWAGKCNACRVGAEAAQGEWLLFTDADCRFSEDLIDAMLSIAHAKGTALLSAVGRLTYKHRFERVLQPVASTVLLRVFPLNKANRDEKRWPFANGQFLLFRRDDYDAFGGHAAVRDALLEDLAFARGMHARGMRLGAIDATRRMEVSMYDSVRAMRAGWTRIFIESYGRRPSKLVRSAIELLAISTLLPAAALAALVVGATGAISGVSRGVPDATLVAACGAISLALAFVAVALMHQRQRAPISGVVLHPFAALMVAWWLYDGARMLRKQIPVRWGGRSYVLKPQ
jgi:glycosyltransferase involved in cell wall biosynthesis